MDDNKRRGVLFFFLFSCRDRQLVPDCLWSLHVASNFTSLLFYNFTMLLPIVSNSEMNIVEILCVIKLNLDLLQIITTKPHN